MFHRRRKCFPNTESHKESGQRDSAGRIDLLAELVLPGPCSTLIPSGLDVGKSYPDPLLLVQVCVAGVSGNARLVASSNISAARGMVLMIRPLLASET